MADFDQQNKNTDASLAAYYDALHQFLRTTVGRVTAHFKNTDNPHRTNKVHVGLSRVENHAMATKDQAIAGDTHYAYMSPYRTQQLVDARLDELDAEFQAAADEMEQ